MSDTVRRTAVLRRKSYLIFSAALVGIVSGVIACNDSPAKAVAPISAVASAQNAPANNNPLRSVGEGHNAIVDAVLRDVAKKRSGSGPHKKLCKQVEESTIEYARINARNPGEAVRIVKSLDFCGTRNGSSAIRGSSLRANIAEGSGLPQRAIDLLNAANYYVGISYSSRELDSYLGPINSAAMAELSGEDAEVVTASTAVAVSSLGYWIANHASISAQLGVPTAYLKAEQDFNRVPGTMKNSFWGEVWDIAKADLEGAIAGGIAAKLAKAAVPEYALWTAAGKSLTKLVSKL